MVQKLRTFQSPFWNAKFEQINLKFYKIIFHFFDTNWKKIFRTLNVQKQNINQQMIYEDIAISKIRSTEYSDRFTHNLWKVSIKS